MIVTAQNKDEITNELISIYHSADSTGLNKYCIANPEKISIDLIKSLAKKGYFSSSAENLEIAKILAEIKNDYSSLGWVYLFSGKSKLIIGGSVVEDLNNSLNNFIKCHDTSGIGQVYLCFGDFDYQKCNYQTSKEYYLKALPLFQQQESVYFGHVYKGLGDVNGMTDDLNKAKEYYHKALIFYKEANDLRGQGNIYASLGKMEYWVNNNSQAENYYIMAMPFYQQLLDSLGQANIYIHLGDIAFSAGNMTKAEENNQKALSFYQNIHMSRGQGDAYSNLGRIAFLKGNNEKGEEYFQTALMFYQMAHYKTGMADVYKLLGDCTSLKGNDSKAEEYYLKALPIIQSVQNRMGEGAIYLSLGDISFRSGNNIKAKENYQDALTIFQEINSPLGEGNVHLSLGNLEVKASNYQKAEEYYFKALPLLQLAQEPTSQGSAFQGLGDIAFKTGNIFGAKEYYNKALSFYRIAQDSYDEENVLFSLGKSFRDSDPMKALAYFESAIQKSTKIRSSGGNPTDQITFTESIFSDFASAIDFMIKNGFTDKAFGYYESLKARSFTERLYDKNVARTDKGIPVDLKQKLDLLTDSLSVLQSKIYDETDTNKREDFRKDCVNVEDDLEKLSVEIRIKHPQYFEYHLNISRQQLQDNVLKNGEAIVEYFNCDSSYYAFIIKKDGFRIVKLADKSKNLTLDISQYCLTLKDKNDKQADGLKGFEVIDTVSHSKNQFVSATSIYNVLVGNLKQYLRGINTLIIVPDGPTSVLPFECLVSETKDDGSFHYLLEDYTIKYIQSSTVLGFQRGTSKNEKYPLTFAGFGDPVYDYENFSNHGIESGSALALNDSSSSVTGNMKSYDKNWGKLNRLIWSGEEVKQVTSIFDEQSKENKMYLRENATEENAKSKDLKNYGYLLFSCHGALADDYQSIVLSQIPGQKEDGFLTTSEIMNLDWHARLVVLSACETGKGKIFQGEGVTGLTRAVMYAGAKATLVSLWNVSDQGTKELMTHFFSRVVDKSEPPEEALRNAKLEMLKNPRYNQPFYWGAFVLYGE
jgi:CHAT domain-containing protein/tetratricopeptide (TPR) repeat protein